MRQSTYCPHGYGAWGCVLSVLRRSTLTPQPPGGSLRCVVVVVVVVVVGRFVFQTDRLSPSPRLPQEQYWEDELEQQQLPPSVRPPSEATPVNASALRSVGGAIACLGHFSKACVYACTCPVSIRSTLTTILMVVPVSRSAANQRRIVRDRRWTCSFTGTIESSS